MEEIVNVKAHVKRAQDEWSASVEQAHLVSEQLCAWRPKWQAQGPSGHAYSKSTPNQVVSRHQVAAVQGDSHSASSIAGWAKQLTTRHQAAAKRKCAQAGLCDLRTICEYCSPTNR
jgi:hypothetical protein